MPHLDNQTTRDFARLYPAHVAAFSRLLVTLRRVVGGDLDMVLILAVIGDLHFAHRTDPDSPRYDALGRTPATDAPTTNVYSLASYVGIPRETVRRKVAALVERGWVRADARGNLVPTPEAARALEEGTDAAVRFLEEIEAARVAGETRSAKG